MLSYEIVILFSSEFSFEGHIMEAVIFESSITVISDNSVISPEIVKRVESKSIELRFVPLITTGSLLDA